MKKLLTITVSCLLFLTSQTVCAETSYSPNKISQSMAKILYEIEQASGRDHQVSQRIKELDEQGQQILYNAVHNKEKFVNSADKALQRIDAVKKSSVIYIYPPAGTQKKVEPLPVIPPLKTPFSPSYPSESSAAYNIAKALGLTGSNQERCDDSKLEVYEDILYIAEEAGDIGDAVCTVAGCDITGVGCALACGLVEGFKLTVRLAKVPSDACEKHGAGVNEAEIQAGHKNSISILENQKIIVDNQKTIIKLLLTPQGRRPGWNR